MVKAMEATHLALKADVSLAERVGRKVFPASEAALIARLIKRDLPFYGINAFARKVYPNYSESPALGKPPAAEKPAIQLCYSTPQPAAASANSTTCSR
jgi:hypothetical protein